MAFVLVQHLDPQRVSMLVELLSAKTTMPVTAAADGIPVTGNLVFVIPPNAVLAIVGGILRLLQSAPARQHRVLQRQSPHQLHEFLRPALQVLFVLSAVRKAVDNSRLTTHDYSRFLRALH